MSANFLAVATQATERKSAEVRREEILEAAMKEFAYGGLHGTSTEKIAQRAGISQPYLFRLFGTKKEPLHRELAGAASIASWPRSRRRPRARPATRR